ncbi:MAG TPA: ATP cone domain-containing protein [Candidatus Paceibacterota bacterium]
MMQHLIVKADGEREPFDPTKMERSLEHAGASSTMSARILARIMHELRPETTTEEIYRKAFEMLKSDEAMPVAARYSMKRAIFSLGPSGFPFEQFLAEILKAHGWHTRTDVMLMGRCAPHEVDVLAEKDKRKLALR